MDRPVLYIRVNLHLKVEYSSRIPSLADGHMLQHGIVSYFLQGLLFLRNFSKVKMRFILDSSQLQMGILCIDGELILTLLLFSFAH